MKIVEVVEDSPFTIRVVPDDSPELAPGSAAEFKRKTQEIVVRDRNKNNQFILYHEIGHGLLDQTQPPQWILAFEDYPVAWQQFLATATARSYQTRERMTEPNDPRSYDWVEAGADLYMEYRSGRLNDKPDLVAVLKSLLIGGHNS